MSDHKFRPTVSNKVDEKRYSYHKVKTIRKGGKWRFQIFDFFDILVHESEGLGTQREARDAGKAYRDKNHPKKK